MILTVVMTHSEAADTTARHRFFWEKTSDRLVYTYPKNGGPIPAGVEQVEIGEMEHHGPVSRDRIIQILTWAAVQKDWDFFTLHEYDSIALSIPKRALPAPGWMAGTVYANNKPEVFSGPFYIHYPHIYTRHALLKILAQMLLSRAVVDLPEDTNWSDRYIGWAAWRAGVQVLNHKSAGLSYSKNTILPEHSEALKRAVTRGVVLFHGIKTQEILDVCTKK